MPSGENSHSCQTSTRTIGTSFQLRPLLASLTSRSSPPHRPSWVSTSSVNRSFVHRMSGSPCTGPGTVEDVGGRERGGGQDVHVGPDPLTRPQFRGGHGLAVEAEPVQRRVPEE